MSDQAPSPVPTHLHVVIEATAETVTFWPHYTSTYCQHEAHDACRLVCKTCEAPCRCACHKDEQP